ncbi:MAG: DUF3783 domain-containing protein [Clostridia bacterium]|nr:DUF3783 domain-containing protein [Clostridia bacterium]
MAKMMETVLYYNPGRPETMKHVAMMKSVLVRMGVRIKNIGPEQVLEKVGYLAGMEGYEAAEGSAGGEGARSVPGELPVIPEEVMVLKQFSSQRLDMLLSGLRRAGVPRIALKAVLTEHNSDWTFYHLYQELKEEHETMTAGQQS